LRRACRFYYQCPISTAWSACRLRRFFETCLGASYLSHLANQDSFTLSDRCPYLLQIKAKLARNGSEGTGRLEHVKDDEKYMAASRLLCVPNHTAQHDRHTAIGTIHDGGDGKGMGGRHGGYAKSWADMGEYKEVGGGGEGTRTWKGLCTTVGVIY
jgi:hypothetical protein